MKGNIVRILKQEGWFDYLKDPRFPQFWKILQNN